MPLYFNADHLPAQTNEYVAWVDVMGTQSSMSRSLSATANFIFKLHAAALQAPHAHMTLYPVMDGIYAAAATQADMLAFLRSVFQEVAQEFNVQPNNMYRFVTRGGLAFGPVVHGKTLAQAASNTLAANPTYRDQILLGIPMVQAHLSEVGAPPFGVFVHESARAFAPAGSEPLHSIWWKWANNANQPVWDALRQNLQQYTFSGTPSDQRPLDTLLTGSGCTKRWRNNTSPYETSELPDIGHSGRIVLGQ